MSDTPGESASEAPEGSSTVGGMATGGGDVVQYVSGNGVVDLALAVEGVEEGSACSFEIKKVADDSVVTTIQGQVVGGQATGQWTPELDPEAGERGIRVYYITTAGPFTERSPELEVFLDYIDIESQDEDGAALPDATYELRVTGPGCPKGHVRRGRTGSTAKIREAAVPPGEAILEWVGPYEVVEWVDETGPTRKAKLKKVERLKFAWPSPENDGGLRFWNDDGSELELHERFHAHTQVVNFTATDESRTDHPERGNVLRCRVSASPAKAGLAGAKVFAKVVWAPKDQLSKRDTPARRLVGGVDSFPWAQGEGTEGIQLELPADEGEVSFDVDLGRAGGDVCTIYLGATSRCEDAKLVVTNRRTVGYQLTRMAHQSLPSLVAGSVSCVHYLEQLFVDFAQVGSDVLYKDGAPLQGTEPFQRGVTSCPASWFEPSGAGDAVIVGAHNFKWFSTKFKAAEVGDTGVHLVLADQLVNGLQRSDGTTPFAQAFSESWWTGVDAADGSFVPDLEYFARLPNTQGERYQLFPKALHDGGLPLRATWSTALDGLPAELRGKTGEIPAEWMSCDRHRKDERERFGVKETQDGRFGVWVTFPADSIPGKALKENRAVDVVGTLYPGETGVLGFSMREQIVVKLAGTSDNVQNHALAHEVGHNMRQAAAQDPAKDDDYRLPPGLSFGDHPNGYIGHGHNGAHCSAGLSDEDRAKANYRELETHGTCVMYGEATEASVTASTGFCEHCQEFGKAVACNDLHKDTDIAALEEGDHDATDPPPPVVEVALQNDPRQGFPSGGKLEVTAGGAAAPAATLVTGGTWAFATIGVEAGKSYKVALKQGTKSHTLLDGEELEGFAQANAAAKSVHLVVLARKAGAPPAGGGAPTFSELTVTSAELVPQGQGGGHELGEAHGTGRMGDITPVPGGVYTLRVTCEGESAPIEASLVVGQPDDILFESPAQGCNVVRVRAGRPGAWGARWFFVTIAPPTQRILIAPSNQGGDSDLYAASNAASALRDFYKKRGFAADIIRTPRAKADGAGPPKLCDSWEEVMTRLEGASSEPYSRVFTIGHGGYDGTWMNGVPSQVSVREDADSFWRFVDAIKTGTTADARLFFSSCHSGGSNQGEWAEAEKTDAGYVKTRDECKARQAEAEKKRDAATDQATKDRWDVSAKDWQRLAQDAEDQRKYNAMYFARWSEEVARATGRVCAGTMGYTSTDKLAGDTESRSLSHARAALEGEGAARQALWLTDPTAPGGSWIVPPGKNSTAKDGVFRGKAITYPGPLARTGAAATTPPAATPTTTWVPPPLADLPAPVAAGGGP